MTQTVKNTRQYVPPESCGYPANSSLAIYGVVTEYEYDEADSNIIFGWTAVFVNLPPILLPFLTTGLIRILKKYEANRAHLSGGSNEATGYHTTKLVVMMTVCLMVTEASYRISDAIIVFLENYLLDNYAIILARYGSVTAYDIDDADANIILFWTSVFVNLPPILLPFITTGLIRLLKKYEANRAHLSGGSNEATGYHTTKLVVMMTVCLMVTEASYRISDAIILFLGDIVPVPAMLITVNLYMSFRIFYPLNSIAHCLINMMLSSEYRKIVMDLVTPNAGIVRVQPINSGPTRNVPARMT
ncbi:unnamed protein product [Caenorhabditis brenneri]